MSNIAKIAALKKTLAEEGKVNISDAGAVEEEEAAVENREGYFMDCSHLRQDRHKRGAWRLRRCAQRPGTELLGARAGRRSRGEPR